MLIAQKHQWEEVGSSTCEYWRECCKDLGDEAVLFGAKQAEKFTGTLRMGDFRKLCGKPVRAPYHSEFKALPHKAMDGEELRARLAKMRDELGLWL